MRTQAGQSGFLSPACVHAQGDDMINQVILFWYGVEHAVKWLA
jgi:hypothetical protein